MKLDRITREIALPFRRRKGQLPNVARSLADRQLLVSHEAEELVFDERSTHGKPELITLQLVLPAREEVTRIQRRVPDEPKNVAVQRIRSGLGDHVERAAGESALFDTHVAGLSAELLYRVGEREIQVVVNQVVHVRPAIQGVPQVVVAGAIDGDFLLTSWAPGGAPLIAGIAADRRHSGRQQYEVGRVAPV